MHRMLVRQLRRLGISETEVPTPAAWAQLLAAISRSYASAEDDRYLLERSLDLSSREMQALYENLRQASETRLAAEHDRLSSVLAALSDGLCVLDSAGAVVSANAAAEALLGAPESVLRGQTVFARLVLQVEDSGPVVAGAVAIAEVLTERQGRRYERSWLQVGDTRQSVACVLTPLVVRGAVAGVVFVIRDTRAQRAAEEALRHAAAAVAEARDQALQASRSKGAFLANMSHELRTPLNAILGYSELIEEVAAGEGMAVIASDASRIRGAAGHLLQMISDVLDVSQIEAGKVRLVYEEFAVTRMLDGVTSTVLPLVRRGGNDLDVVVDRELGTMVTDRTKLGQALLNLLGNAAKFTRSGTIRLHVQRVTRADGADWFKFVVSDTGIGIAADRLGELFVPFSQIGDASQRRGGTGLGLAISRDYCRLMGGDVEVTSTLGQGSQFTILLPARAPDVDDTSG